MDQAPDEIGLKNEVDIPPRKKTFKIIFIISPVFLIFFGLLLVYFVNKSPKNDGYGAGTPKNNSATKYRQISNPPNPTPFPSTMLLENIILPYRIVFTSGKSVYITDGKTEKKIKQFDNEVQAAHPSPNGKWLAVAYTAGPNRVMFDFKDAKLEIINVQSGEAISVINNNKQTIRYTLWSSDSRYLTFWVNSGEESFVYDTQNKQPIYSIKAAGNKLVSPITFIGNTHTISFIENNGLYMANADGTNRKILNDNAKATRDVHEGPLLPNIPFYSRDTNFVGFYSEDGSLLILDRSKNTIEKIDKGFDGEIFSNSPNAYLIDEFENNTVLYYAYNNGSWSYGDRLPLYLYNLQTHQKAEYNLPLSAEDMLTISHNSAVVSPDRRKVSFAKSNDDGVVLFKPDGKQLSACFGHRNIGYEYYSWSGEPNNSPVLALWSPDSKYMLIKTNLQKSYSVLDTETCMLYRLSPTPMDYAIWMAS